MRKRNDNVIEKSLPKFDKTIVSELKKLLATPKTDEQIKGEVENLLNIEIDDKVFNKLYKLFYTELQKKIVSKTDMVKELLKYRVAKTPTKTDAIHFYLHPDILGDYNSKEWIQKHQEERDFSVLRKENDGA